MDEKDLINLWNKKRNQIIMAQISPALVLIVIMVLAAQGTFVAASDAAKYLAVAVAAVTGFLAIVSQYAAIREAQALVKDLGKVSKPSALATKIESSQQLLSLTAVAMVGFSLVTFALVIWSILG